MQANVRSIEAIDQLRAAVLEFATGMDAVSFEMRRESDRALRWIQEEAPRYWKERLVIAERRLREAADNLATSQATIGGREKPPATEAKKRVATLKRRVAYCQQQLTACKGWAIEVGRAVDRLAAPTAALQQIAESDLPVAAAKLGQWTAALEQYTGRAGGSSNPVESSARPLTETGPLAEVDCPTATDLPVDTTESATRSSEGSR